MTHEVRRRLGALIAAGTTAAALALVPATAAHAAGTYSLLVLPDQGETQIYNFVNSATSSIDMTMYELVDTKATGLLTQAAKNGVTVRVILDQNPAIRRRTTRSAPATCRFTGPTQRTPRRIRKRLRWTARPPRS